MLSRVLRARILVRGYGFEDPTEKMTKNWWQYADSNTFGDATPEERGYQVAAQDVEPNEKWDKLPRVSWQEDIDAYGLNTSKIMDAELRNNPLGDYDTNDQTLPASEIRTRIIHILRHFANVDLRKIDWKSNILAGIGLDEFERVALLTSVEHEFGTVFEDNVFDNLKTLEDVVGYLATDRYVV
jgi:acyl carrier protein